jgi:outer membrane usher protein
MLPESQRGFAPTVRGVANSNATVTVRQNGYVIYQSFVPPGPFIIDDLYQTSSSGDLDVSVEENNGGVTRFTIPYSAVPLLQREGRIKYSLTAGEFRSGSPQKNKPQFGEGSIIVGLGKNLTFFSGIQLANHYKAIAIGSGLNMGKWGAVSADITQANSILADDSHHHGQSMRFLYAKSLNDLGTRFQLIGYRYSTEGFYTLDETAYDRLSGYRWENENLEGKAPILVDSFNLNYAKKGKIQASISQQTGHFGSIYISGSRQTYWRTSKTSDYLQANFNWMLKNVNYSIGYSLARNPWIDNVDRIFSFNLSVPLAEWLTKDSGPGRGSNLNNTAYATYSVTHDSNGKTSQQAGVSGTLLEQNNLGYSVTQGYSNQGGGYGGSTALDWSAGYGRVNTGYNYSKEYRQFNYGVSGGVIVHSDGVTLSQSLGDTNVLIKAPGASDVGVDNTTGVTTDWRGYAVMPYASPYQRNRVALQTTTLKNNTELDDTVLNVVPTQGAVVVADFKVRQGIRGLFTLLKPDGKPVPLGAVVSVKGDNTSQGIVGDNGQIYLAGLGLSGLLNVVWGHMPSQQCEATYQLSSGSENQAIIRAQLGCQ